MVKKIDGFTERGIHLREKFSIVMLIKFVVVFILSLIFYNVINNLVIVALFGFIMIISGALILLFILIYLIFYFVERIDSGSKNVVVTKKKITKKKITKKKITKKKITKKKVTKKKTVKRKGK